MDHVGLHEHQVLAVDGLADLSFVERRNLWGVPLVSVRSENFSAADPVTHIPAEAHAKRAKKARRARTVDFMVRGVARDG